MSSLLFLSSVLAGLVQSTLAYDIESFPSCVEISAVEPQPYSVVQINKDYRTKFDITFSKPVKLVNKYYKYYVTLSSSPARDNARQSTIPVIVPKTVGARLVTPEGSGRKWRAHFSIKEGRTKDPLFRVFYLIVHGVYFYTYDTSRRKIYVPFTSIGPYYIDQQEKEYHGNHTVTPLSPSRYCQPRQRRGRPRKSWRASVENFLHAQIPRRGHHMTPDDLSTVQLLALVNVTEGKGAVPLPPFITANISGMEIDVQLPAWNLTFDLPFIKWSGDMTRLVTLEPNERIYHSVVPAFAINRSIELNLNVDKKQPLLQPYYVHTVKGVDEAYEVFAWPSGPKIMEFQNIYDQTSWFDRVHSGQFYHIKINGYGLPPPDSHLLTQKLPATPVKRCPVDSPRNTGRQAHVFHAIELGPFYQIMESVHPEKWWIRASRSGKDSAYRTVIATTEEGEVKDLSSKAQFGWKNKGISTRVVKALTEDYVCLQTRTTFGFWMKFDIEDGCIYVPKKTALSRDCGGLMLYQNLQSILDVQDFCNREFGDCIGESFYSTERFPVIPPFGLPELTGVIMSWLSAHTGKVKYVFHGDLKNPLNQLDIHQIPITGAKLLFPHIEFSQKGFCSTVWKQDSEETIPSATISAHIHNTGKGGGTFEVGLECSPELLVFPFSQISIQIEKKSEAVVKFSLSGSQVLHKPVAKHTCKMKLAIKMVKEFASKVQTFPECTMSITTYHGLFKDPCNLKGTGLPQVDMMYYNLPVEQMDPLPRDKQVQSRANLPNERRLQLVKAITISLGVQGHQQHLIANLNQLHVYCGRSDILITRTYGEYLVHQAVAGLTRTRTPPKPSLVFSGDDINLSTVYFFMPTRNPDSNEDPVYTDCWAELWANKPHPLCDNPVLIAYATIPLRDHDEAVFEGEEDNLAVLYGPTTDGVRMVLLSSIVACVVLCVVGSIMHAVLLIIRRFLPQQSTLKQYKKDLEKVKQEDIDYWENPQMFLSDGPHGPFYKLHDFRATCPMDSDNIKSLKIAGTLRYEDKELQVLFGHVKKVFVEKGAKTVWVHASSGMYQLCPEQVSLKYREQYSGLMKRHGVKMKSRDYEPEQEDTTTI